MSEQDKYANLDSIPTRADLFDDGNAEGSEAVRARQELVMIYYGAAYRYLFACVKDPLAAEDLAQHFASRLMEGNYIRQANLGQGRFRDYLKRSLQNLVNDYRKKKQRQQDIQPLPEVGVVHSPEEETETYADDEAWLSSIREELIACAWKALGQIERESGTPYASALRIKTEDPKLRAHDIADRLKERLGKAHKPSGVRQIIHRAREKFSGCLLDHVERLLPSAHRTRMEEFLIEMKLLELCKEELQRRQSP